jgi:hypothetical protein
MAATTIAIRGRPRPTAPSGHADFLKQIVSKETDIRTAQRPKPLSAKGHAAHRKQLQQVQFIKPKYAAETEINVTGILAKWKQYVAPRCRAYIQFFI